MGRLHGTFVRCFLLNGMLTCNRPANFFSMKRLGLDLTGTTMDRFNLLSDGARKLAPYIKSTFPLHDIRSSRRKLRTCIISCLEISGGDKEQTERLMNSALLSDKMLQTAANRVLVGITLNNPTFNRGLSTDPFKDMHQNLEQLHDQLLKIFIKYQLIDTDDADSIFKQFSETKSLIKEARKAVA